MDQVAMMWIDGVLLSSPVAKTLGLELLHAEVDHVRLRLPFDSGLTTVGNTVHGGVIATVVDVAGAAASASGIREQDEATGGVTADLSIAYLRPAVGSHLEATAEVTERTRTQTQTSVEVRDAEGQLVATGLVNSRIFHQRRAG